MLRKTRRDKLRLAGARFGKLTVIEEAGRYRNHTLWLCKCDCGISKIVRGAQLVKRAEATRSCGCLRERKSHPVVAVPELIGWAAGIIDGEGCIVLSRDHIGPTKESYSLRVGVSNTDIRMLHKLKELFGGCISKHGRKQKPHHLDKWCWRVGSKCAENCLLQILPWLVVTREQAELAILSRQYRRTSRWDIERLTQQRAIFNRLKSLKRNLPESAGQSTPLVVH